MMIFAQKSSGPSFDPKPLYDCTQAVKDGINVFVQSGNEGI